MVGLDNPLHIAMLLIVVLLVFGAKRLPEMGKSLGEGLRGFKESVSGESPSPARLASETVHVEAQAAPVAPGAVPAAAAVEPPALPTPTVEREPAQPVA